MLKLQKKEITLELCLLQSVLRFATAYFPDRIILRGGVCVDVVLFGIGALATLAVWKVA